jgi:hypothetical protein
MGTETQSLLLSLTVTFEMKPLGLRPVDPTCNRYLDGGVCHHSVCIILGERRPPEPSSRNSRSSLVISFIRWRLECDSDLPMLKK